MSFKVPEKYRFSEPGQMFSTDSSYGCNGVFIFNVGDKHQFRCIASDGLGWEHVSVSVMYKPGSDPRIIKERCPLWEEMCLVKDLFWDEEDCVIQYHPPKTDHVSMHHYCLHLWRPIGIELPRPDPLMVGVNNT